MFEGKIAETFLGSKEFYATVRWTDSLGMIRVDTVGGLYMDKEFAQAHADGTARKLNKSHDNLINRYRKD